MQTEAKARETICPLAMAAGKQTKCFASACQWWIWLEEFDMATMSSKPMGGGCSVRVLAEKIDEQASPR